jgi:hypothetical protein
MNLHRRELLSSSIRPAILLQFHSKIQSREESEKKNETLEIEEGCVDEEIGK